MSWISRASGRALCKMRLNCSGFATKKSRRAAGVGDEAAELLAQLVKATDFDALHRDLDAYALADLPHDDDAYVSTTALRALNISVEEARKLVLAAASIKT